MEAIIPSSSEVRSRLERLGHAQVQTLAGRSGVPFTTLWKIRGGETENPGLETVRKFLHHIESVLGGDGNQRAEPAAEHR